MSAAQLLVAYAVGAAAVAFWFDARFPELGPATIRRALVHVLVALAVGQLIVPLGLHALLGVGGPVATLVALFVVAFPALAYAFLTAFWVIKIVAGSARGYA
jgi:hypothetical protein